MTASSNWEGVSKQGFGPSAHPRALVRQMNTLAADFIKLRDHANRYDMIRPKVSVFVGSSFMYRLSRELRCTHEGASALITANDDVMVDGWVDPNISSADRENLKNNIEKRLKE